MFLGMVTLVLPLNGSEDPYSFEAELRPQVDYYYQEKNRQTSIKRQEQFRKRVSIQHAVGENVPYAIARSPGAGGKKISANSQDPSAGLVRQGILLIIASFLSLILFVRMLAPEFFKTVFMRFNPLASGGAGTSLAAKVRAEDEAFGVFLASFQAGPVAAAVNGAASASGQPLPDDGDTDFCTKTTRLFARQRSLLQDISGSTDAATRRPMLADLGREIQSLKSATTSPEKLPAWQLASALEGLVKQLTDKAGNVTRSTLRTVGGAVDLLEKLCQSGVRADLLTDPPVRFLAVDDDLICRTAISFALKKAFNQPDLAENGPLALGLTTKHTYDAIFLDVQMQGMDGFELCSKIHETSLNQETPVVFVTCMSDFDAHAQSVLSGGSDLIGKPFLTFEITVKALTLALGRRLHAPSDFRAGSAMKPEVEVLPQDPAVLVDSLVTPNPAPTVGQTGLSGSAMELPAGDMDSDNLTIRDANGEIPAEANEAFANHEQAFLTRASTHVEALRERVRQLSEATSENMRQDTLADLYLWLHALTPGKETVAHPAMRLSTALEGLLKKLLEDPQNWTSSALLTITNAMDLLDDLCASGVNVDRLASQPIHILVVDDDLISRRAIAGALQMAFEKPQSAENGAAAVALATEKPFDLIFMDVQMPGMDGFTACANIRQTKANRTTPLVFVTGQTDANTRAQAATSGGNGFIAKPFLMAEVTVKALTFALRGRLQQSYATDVCQTTPQKVAGPAGPESRRSRKRRLARQAVT